jgi:hypothetical protein
MRGREWLARWRARERRLYSDIARNVERTFVEFVAVLRQRLVR